MCIYGSFRTFEHRQWKLPINRTAPLGKMQNALKFTKLHPKKCTLERTFLKAPRLNRRCLFRGRRVYSIQCTYTWLDGWSGAGMHAPPRPGPGGNGCPGAPRPQKFSTLPRPTPEKEGAAPPRPAPKITLGQESGQTFLHHQKFLGVNNF